MNYGEINASGQMTPSSAQSSSRIIRSASISLSLSGKESERIAETGLTVRAREASVGSIAPTEKKSDDSSTAVGGWLGSGLRWADIEDSDDEDDILSSVLGPCLPLLEEGTYVRAADGTTRLSLTQEWMNCPLLKPLIDSALRVGKIAIVWTGTPVAYKESGVRDFFADPRKTTFLEILKSRMSDAAGRIGNPEAAKTLKALKTLTVLIQHVTRMLPAGDIPAPGAIQGMGEAFAWQTKAIAWIEQRSGESRSSAQKFFGFVNVREQICKILADLVGMTAANQLVSVVEVTMREGIRRCMSDLKGSKSPEAQKRFEELEKRLNRLLQRYAPKADITVNLLLPKQAGGSTAVRTRTGRVVAQPKAAEVILRPTVRNSGVLELNNTKDIIATWNHLVSRAFDEFSSRRLNPICRDRPSDVLRDVRVHLESVQRTRSIFSDKIGKVRELIRQKAIANRSDIGTSTANRRGVPQAITPQEWVRAQSDVRVETLAVEATILAELSSRMDVANVTEENFRAYASRILFGKESSDGGLSLNWLIPLGSSVLI